MHIHLKDPFNFVLFFGGINFTSNFLFQKVYSVLALKKNSNNFHKWCHLASEWGHFTVYYSKIAQQCQKVIVFVDA